MVNLITIDTSRGDVSFLFGTRALSIASKLMGVGGLNEFARKFSDPGFEEVVTLLYAGHENACFYLKKDLVVKDRDDMFLVLDEIGMTKGMEVVTEAIMQMAGDMAGKKKVEAKTRT
jgi:hypothetical protein